MRALKIGVIAMGVLIIVGFTIMVTELIRRSSVSPGPDEAVVSHDMAAFDLAAGERMVALTAVDGRLVVLVEGTDGTQRMVSIALDRLR